MHADQHVVAVPVRAGDVALDQRHVFDVLVDAGVADRAELAVPGRDARLGDTFDVLLVLAPPLDQVGDGDQREVVLVGEDAQLVGLRHRAFVFLADDLADRACGLQAREPGQIHGRLGVAGTAQHAAVLGTQRNHVPGLGEIVGHGGRVGEEPHRGRPVRRRDTGSDTDFRIDGDGVGGTVLVLVDRVHRQQAQPVADVAVERHAQVTGGVAHHERHQFGVAFSAAKIRSPSFSRSSSSMTTTALPAAMSATARSTGSSLVIFTTLPVPAPRTTCFSRSV